MILPGAPVRVGGRWALLAVLPLLPAVVLSLALLSGLEWLPVVLLTSFAPYAAPLWLLGLVLLGGATLHARRRAVAAATVLALVATTLSTAGLALSWRATGAAPGASADLSAMTANLQFGRGDAQRVVELVRANEVDLLTVQEITREALDSLDAAGLGETLGHRAGQASEGPHGTMLFSRFPLTDVRRLPTRLGSWAATADTPDGPVAVLAVHAGRPDRGGVEVWVREHELLREAARDRIERGLPVMLLGDLNATPDHTVVRAYRDAGLRRAANLVGAGPQPTWPSAGVVQVLGVPLRSVITIDHVLLGPGLTATRSATATVPGADHRAVLAGVARTPSAAP